MASEIVFQATEVPLLFSVVETPIVFQVQPMETVAFSIQEQALSFPTTVEQLAFTVKEEVLAFSITSGAVGPQGPPGIPEEEMVYAKRVDFITDSLLYRGEAAVGTATSAAAWRIRRLTIGADNDVTEEWADGTADFTKVWDNRASYTYA